MVEMADMFENGYIELYRWCFNVFDFLVLVIYVAAKETYIRLLHGKIGFLVFFRP